MGGDIEAFLRMAAERRRQAQAGGQPMPAQQAPPQPARQRPPEQRPAPSPRPAVEEQPVSAKAGSQDFDPYAQANDLPERSNSVRSQPKQKAQQQPGKGQTQPTPATPGPLHLAPSNIGAKKSDVDSVHDQPLKTYENIGDRVVRLITEPSTVVSAMILSEILKPRAFDDLDV